MMKNGLLSTMAAHLPKEDHDVSMRDCWVALQTSGSKSAREAIFIHYMPYAKSIAAQLFAGRQHHDVEFNDFQQLAYIGLIESIGRFDTKREVSFKTYCTPRIRGAVLNGIEKLTEAQEQISFNRRRRRERVESLKDTSGSHPTFDTLATLAAGLAIGFMLEGTGMFTAESEQRTPYGDGYESVAWQQKGEAIQKAVEDLTENVRKVIRYHYYEALPFEQIASILGLSKGRISQLHRAGLDQLRKTLHSNSTMHITG